MRLLDVTPSRISPAEEPFATTDSALDFLNLEMGSSDVFCEVRQHNTPRTVAPAAAYAVAGYLQFPVVVVPEMLADSDSCNIGDDAMTITKAAFLGSAEGYALVVSGFLNYIPRGPGPM